NAKGFRLPTNNEWELAARYINDINGDGDILDPGEYYPGDHISGDTTETFEFSSVLGNYAWYFDNSINATHIVGDKTTNALGLYDISGNVSEWVFDWYYLFIGTKRVCRGGSYGNIAVVLRIGNVRYNNPYDKAVDLGFRFARNP
ncbi:MAG: formylglycine-generating enzyme family protein, partial [Spirochaetia bacterium]|nr:formylglycine-generating enzyme family protein [Spirochaetia bacterium]